MVMNKKAQAAFEYLSTYGWAILAALIVVGALAYFGFLNPNNLLPNKCDFGKQMECVDYRIRSDGAVNLTFRNNFGKAIEITDINWENTVTGSHPFSSAIPIQSGETKEVSIILDTPYRTPAGEKQELNLVITFQRAGVPSPAQHNVTGTVFVTVQ
jgi:hypothetical protein